MNETVSEPVTKGMPESPATAPAPAAAPKSSSNTAMRLVIVAVVLLVLGAAGYAYWSYAAVRETTDDAQVEASIHTVSARVGGTVTKVLVLNNQQVKAGDVLVELDSQDYQVALDRAKADLAEAVAKLGEEAAGVPVISTVTSSQMSGARASIGEVQAAIGAAGKQVEAAQAREASVAPLVRAAEANAERAAADFERMKTLLAKDEVARRQFDEARAAADATRAQVDAARAQVAEAKQGIDVARSLLERERSRLPRSEAEVNAAEAGPQQIVVYRAKAASAAAKVAQMKAVVAAAELNLERAVVRAPISGIIGQKSVETGEVIQPGQPLMAVVAVGDVWVVANYKENQLAHMRPGQKVDLAVDAFGGKRLHGVVNSIAGATGARFSLLPPENATGNYVKVVQRIPVKIYFDPGQDPDAQLRPGMSVVSTILINSNNK